MNRHPEEYLIKPLNKPSIISLQSECHKAPRAVARHPLKTVEAVIARLVSDGAVRRPSRLEGPWEAMWNPGRDLFGIDERLN